MQEPGTPQCAAWVGLARGGVEGRRQRKTGKESHSVKVFVRDISPPSWGSLHAEINQQHRVWNGGRDFVPSKCDPQTPLSAHRTGGFFQVDNRVPNHR